jgi:hypothetical protein
MEAKVVGLPGFMFSRPKWTWDGEWERGGNTDRAQLLQDGLDVVCLAHADPPRGDHHIA